MSQSSRRVRVSQPTLFHPPPARPHFQMLPQDIQDRAIRLLARLLRLPADQRSPVRRRRRVMSDKIRAQHVGRKAILYVRQSSAYQVTHNLESQRLQYAMQDRLQHLGWREIDVVDDDLGRSAAGTVTRGVPLCAE